MEKIVRQLRWLGPVHLLAGALLVVFCWGAGSPFIIAVNLIAGILLVLSGAFGTYHAYFDQRRQSK